LNARAGVVKEREQGVIALAFDCGTIWLRQDCSHLMLLQIAEFTLTSTLHRNAEYFRALACGQGLAIDQERKKATEGCQPAVPRCDRYPALFLAVFQKGQHIGGREIGQLKLGDRHAPDCSNIAEKQTPGIAVGQYRVPGGVALLHQPAMKKCMQQTV
jgi:hypothetical protein